MKRSLSFGSAAEDYERHRPAYPDDLAELIMKQTGTRPRTAFEIGAGTGKATRLIAAAGIEVTALEPDPDMIAVLERECRGLPVRVVRGVVEDPGIADLGPYDLVFAAAALHWTVPEGRWDRIARLLRPGGSFACLGGPPQTDEATAEIEGAVLADNGLYFDPPGPISPDGTPAWPADELLADDRFTDIREEIVDRVLVLDPDRFLQYLNTASAYRSMPDDTRATVFDQLRERLPEHIELRFDIVIHTARRVG